MANNLDKIDLKILSTLQADCSISNSDLAASIHMAPSAALERVKKLQKNGIIEGYHARVKPEAIQLKLLAFIFIKSAEGPGSLSVAKQLSKLPEVLELHHVAGDDCYLLKIRVNDPQSLAQFMRDKLSKIPGILSTKTTIVLESMKETNILPVPKEL